MKDFSEQQENLNDLMASAPTLILQFGDDSCAPCHAIRFRLDQWLEGHPEVAARYIDIRSHLALCAQMGILSAPTAIVFMDGKVAARESGYFSLDEMLGRVERYLKMRGKP